MMNRILEPELMVDEAQVLAYAQADFDEENQGFVERFRDYFPDFRKGGSWTLAVGLPIFRSGSPSFILPVR